MTEHEYYLKITSLNDVGILNHEDGTFVWYHSTPKSRYKSIKQNGLKINSLPTYQDVPEPWIYVSSHPFIVNNDFITFKVNLSWLNHEYAGWPFGEDEKPLHERWQLRIFCDIAYEHLTLI